MPLLEVQHVQKIYTTRFGGTQVQALSNVSFSVEEGEYVAIMGESDSGKTTLLNILAALDRPTAGEVLLEGRPLSAIRERDLAAFRRSHLGFVFQDIRFLDGLTVQENILLLAIIGGTVSAMTEARADQLCDVFGISAIRNKYPAEISGGKKQRTAVARPLIPPADPDRRAYEQLGLQVLPDGDPPLPAGQVRPRRHHLHGAPRILRHLLLRPGGDSPGWSDMANSGARVAGAKHLSGPAAGRHLGHGQRVRP